MQFCSIDRAPMATASWRVALVGLAITAALPDNSLGGDPGNQELIERNTEVPFCYLPGAVRSWRILRNPLSSVESVTLTAQNAGQVVVTGAELDISGLHIKVTPDGRLQIDAKEASDSPSFELEVRLSISNGESQSQRLAIRKGPPPRPISYVSDFSSEITHIFANRDSGTYRQIDRDGLDQYFRRLQAQGISRLIIWLSPFPFITSPADHRPEDWERYERQARAIIECHRELLGDAGEPGDSTDFHFATNQTALTSWTWMAQLLALRLNPEFGEMLSESASEHGIALTASFRPFEIALTKYYEVPVFDGDGNYLWGFLPLAAPIVNYHPEEVGFAHYRTILAHMGQEDLAEPVAIELTDVDAEELARAFSKGELDFEVAASKYPPLDPTSLVLIRDSDGMFALRPFQEIHDKANIQRVALKRFRVDAIGPNKLRISGLSIPLGYRYLVITNPTKADNFVKATEVVVQSKAETELGRLNWYWTLSDAADPTRSTQYAGITADGEFRTTFQTTSNSIQLQRDNLPRERFAGASLVIDLGRPWESEMMDFERPAARQFVVTQLKRLLSYPAFDEIFINTRTHTQLAGCMGDGAEGIRTQLDYLSHGRDYHHLGTDRAYAPRSLAENPRLQQMATKIDGTGLITNWQSGEWHYPYETNETRYVWRFERRRAIANGVRRLLQDIEGEFAGIRVRAVVPPTESTIQSVYSGLNQLQKPGGTVYGRDYYRFIWASTNHIPEIGEAMAVTDFGGLSVEPVFLGIRFAPDEQPLKLFLRECFRDLSDNRGSKFRGPRSFFYEAQETLRGDDAYRTKFGKRREEIICELLSHSEEVKEVLLYEAADWTYMLPLSDPELCGHTFIDGCGRSSQADQLQGK